MSLNLPPIKKIAQIMGGDLIGGEVLVPPSQESSPATST